METVKYHNLLHHDITCFVSLVHQVRAVAKDTDHNNLRKPLDGQPLGAFCMPVTPLTHLKDTNKHMHHNIFKTFAPKSDPALLLFNFVVQFYFFALLL